MRTPLYDEHVRLGAKIVDFHGWLMPLQYASIVEEHRAVRSASGLFDLSHMGRILVSGRDRKDYLNRLLTADVRALKPGRCKYTFFLTEDGTVIDDLLVYEDAEEDRSLLVVNAANRPRDLEWMQTHLDGFHVHIHDVTEKLALIAVQGPRSVDVVRLALDVDPGGLRYYAFGRFPRPGGHGAFISRTGYTGEDGFEVFIHAGDAAAAWRAFLSIPGGAAPVPVGLGARDTLRTEAAMPLHGQEIDERTSPLEAGLEFAIAWDKLDFIGKSALQRRKSEGPSRRLVGFRLSGKRIPRPGMDVYAGGVRTGTVTSGTYSPTLDGPIGMAYISADHSPPGTALEIDVRGRREPAEVVPLPFHKRTPPKPPASAIP